MNPSKFSPGFRLSSLDIFVLVIGIVAAVVLWQSVWWWGFLVGFVVGHFFLFCNLFRIARVLELIWAGIFMAIIYCCIMFEIPLDFGYYFIALFDTFLDLCRNA